MSDGVISRNEAQALSQEYKKTAKTIAAILLAKLEAAGRSANNKIGIYVQEADSKEVTRDIADKTNLGDKLSPKSVQCLQAAFENPEEFKGNVTIFVGREKVFDLVNGKVLADTLNLASQEREKQESKTNSSDTPKQEKEREGKDLVPYLKKIIEIKQMQQQADFNQPFEFKSAHFIVSQNNNQLIVRRLSDKRIVMGDYGFSKNATASDKELLQNIKAHSWYLQSELAAQKLPPSRSPEAKLVEYAEELLEQTSQWDKKGFINFTHHPLFYFSQQGQELSVICRDGRGEVFNRNGFTEIATEGDKNELEKIKFFVQASREEPVLEVKSPELDLEMDY